MAVVEEGSVECHRAVEVAVVEERPVECHRTVGKAGMEAPEAAHVHSAYAGMEATHAHTAEPAMEAAHLRFCRCRPRRKPKTESCGREASRKGF